MTTNHKHFPDRDPGYVQRTTPTEGMRCIKKIINTFGEQEAVSVEFTVFDVRKGAEVPGMDFDAYISHGWAGQSVHGGRSVGKRSFLAFWTKYWPTMPAAITVSRSICFHLPFVPDGLHSLAAGRCKQEKKDSLRDIPRA